MKEYNRKYYQMNKEEIKKQKKQYYIDNKERIKGQFKQYYIDNKEEMKEYQKQYNIDNKGKVKERSKQYYINHREEKRKYFKPYSEGYKKERNKQTTERRKMDLKFNLNCGMANAIGHSLRGNKAGRHWETLIGYSLSDLIKQLKKTFPEGYTWNDYLKGKLHIDHKIPISVFNFNNPNQIDFQRCWALSNLQLLPARENIVKGNKLSRPFQPALKLEILI